MAVSPAGILLDIGTSIATGVLLIMPLTLLVLIRHLLLKKFQKKVNLNMLIM